MTAAETRGSRQIRGFFILLKWTTGSKSLTCCSSTERHCKRCNECRSLAGDDRRRWNELVDKMRGCIWNYAIQQKGARALPRS